MKGHETANRTASSSLTVLLSFVAVCHAEGCINMKLYIISTLCKPDRAERLQRKSLMPRLMPHERVITLMFLNIH